MFFDPPPPLENFRKLISLLNKILFFIFFFSFLLKNRACVCLKYTVNFSLHPVASRIKDKRLVGFAKRGRIYIGVEKK